VVVGRTRMGMGVSCRWGVMVLVVEMALGE